MGSELSMYYFYRKDIIPWLVNEVYDCLVVRSNVLQ